ncbi:unnamed protein product [Paramecium octaurelia]|uniref:Uncharacterized protein n=1 Tax=Paramecium octaurelia TaxID=43137 RepID=A0A8S1U3S3_PAROT|nr:unnamed protein product [Paramecium octaurelia]
MDGHLRTTEQVRLWNQVRVYQCQIQNCKLLLKNQKPFKFVIIEHELNHVEIFKTRIRRIGSQPQNEGSKFLQGEEENEVEEKLAPKNEEPKNIKKINKKKLKIKKMILKMNQIKYQHLRHCKNKNWMKRQKKIAEKRRKKSKIGRKEEKLAITIAIVISIDP